MKNRVEEFNTRCPGYTENGKMYFVLELQVAFHLEPLL